MNTDKLQSATGLTEDELDTMFEYLFDLQDSGATNMFGASAYLEDSFDLAPRHSAKVLAFWMQNYDSLKQNFAERRVK